MDHSKTPLISSSIRSVPKCDSLSIGPTSPRFLLGKHVEDASSRILQLIFFSNLRCSTSQIHEFSSSLSVSREGDSTLIKKCATGLLQFFRYVERSPRLQITVTLVRQHNSRCDLVFGSSVTKKGWIYICSKPEDPTEIEMLS